MRCASQIVARASPVSRPVVASPTENSHRLIIHLCERGRVCFVGQGRTARCWPTGSWPPSWSHWQVRDPAGPHHKQGHLGVKYGQHQIAQREQGKTTQNHLKEGIFTGALGEIRTPDPRIRSPILNWIFQRLRSLRTVKPATLNQWLSWILSNREVPHVASS